MNVNVENWTISKLLKYRDLINEQPEYQRGEVWDDKKKSLLIDSIIRGVDIPKIYLRKLENGGYEVADGQQRITSLFKFVNNQLKLPSHVDKGLDLSTVNNEKIGGLKFENLSNETKKKFNNYKLTIAIVNGARGDEIRILFGRLQEGVNLIPAEKRNAIISKIGRHIDNFSLNHTFFLNSRISKQRYKRQDYLSHAIALIAYENIYELKADLLLKLYLDNDFELTDEIQKNIASVLDKMNEIDQASSCRIYKKFHFIDIFWLLFKNVNTMNNINSNSFARVFDDFEIKRLGVADPKSLIEGEDPSIEDQNLYQYYMAFRYEGSNPKSIEKRNDVYRYLFIN